MREKQNGKVANSYYDALVYAYLFPYYKGKYFKTIYTRHERQSLVEFSRLNETYFANVDGHLGIRGRFELTLNCMGGCPPVLTIPGTPSLGSYHADSAVVSDATIQTPKLVLYKAGTEINLGSNFGVESGAEFDAIIEPCVTLLQGGNSARQATINDKNKNQLEKK